MQEMSELDAVESLKKLHEISLVNNAVRLTYCTVLLLATTDTCLTFGTCIHVKTIAITKTANLDK